MPWSNGVRRVMGWQSRMIVRRNLLLLGFALALVIVAYVHYNVYSFSKIVVPEMTSGKRGNTNQNPADLRQRPAVVPKLKNSKTARVPERPLLQFSPSKPSDQAQSLGLATNSKTTAIASTSVAHGHVSSKDASEEEILKRIREYTNTFPNTTEVSVVTAYFNLGPLNKRGSEGRYTPDLYRRWMSVFGWIDNPLVVFADTQDTVDYFRQIRARYPAKRTTIFLVKRKDLWAFQLEEEIKKIYSQPGYPRHPPNTINPLYSCAMHAKFELIQRVVRDQLYQSRFVAWLDIGLFRDESKKKETIHLTAPTDFKRTHVGYSQVNKFFEMTPQNVIKQNRVWVGGASFLATPEVAYVYCSDYRRAVRKLLDMKWMSTDQQVIYSMFQPGFNFSRRFQMQAYSQHISNAWFDIGYRMKAAP